MGVIHLGIGRKVPKGRDICIPTADIGFPGGSDGKESACNAGDLGLIPGPGRSSEEGNGSLLGESHGQRSLVGYSPWAHKESNTTERLNALTLGLPVPSLLLFTFFTVLFVFFSGLS